MPPGGPEDRTPPYVLAVFPESLAVGVDPGSEIRILFSEKVDKRSLESALWFSGTAVPRSISLDGPEARIRLREPLPEGASMGVLVSTAVKDKRRIAMEAPYRWAFATGDTMPAGTVRGTLETVGRGGRGQRLVGVYAVSGDTLPDPAVETPEAMTEAGPRGGFLIEGLVPDGRVRLVYAFVDQDGNRIVEGRGEFYSAAPESLLLRPDRPDMELALRLVDPEAPGEVQGVMARAEGDTVALGIELVPAGPDSADRSPVRGEAGRDGRFTLRRVPPGLYRVQAYCDLNGNRRRDETEAGSVLREGVLVPPGETLELGELPGLRCGVPEPEGEGP